MRKSLFVLALLLFSVPSFASIANVYLAQAAAGGNTGADCANAHAITFFNTAGNWGAGAGQIGSDTVVHLCGTITSEIAFQGSGTSGHPVTVLFETGANISISPGMDAAGVVAMGANSFLTIDGGASQPCGWNTATNLSEGTCNGIVRNMLYGSSNGTCPGGTCTTQYSSTGNSLIKGTGHDIEIRNLEIGPCYVHTPTGAGFSDMSGGCGTITDESGSNWNIHDSKIHDGAWSVNIQFNSGNLSNITVASNEMYFNSHHFAIDGGNHIIDTVVIKGNYAHDMYVWDTSGDAWHANFVHFFTAAGAGTASNIVINNNIIGGNTGADVTAEFLFSEQFTSFGPLAVFNNLSKATTSPNLGGSDHFWGPSQCDTGCLIYNNTMARQTVTGGNLDLGFSGTMSATIKNNVMQGASTNVVVTRATSLVFDYNAYGPSTSCWKWLTNGFTCTFATWKSQSGEGTHSIFNASSLSLDANFHPSAGSPLIGAGVDLTSSCSGNLTALCSDLAGVARPNGSAWDVGAYQFAAATQASPSTCSPTSGNVASTTCTNPNAGTTVQCYTVNGTTPATAGNGTSCTTGTLLTSPSGTISLTSPVTVKIIAGTSTLTDSTVNSYTFTTSPVVQLVPTSIHFGNVVVNTTSAQSTVTLTNTGAASLTITSVALTTGTQFAKGTGADDTCSGQTIAASGTCIVKVAFAPTTTGIKVDTLVYTDSASDSPQNVALSGTGIAAAGPGLTAGPGVTFGPGSSPQ